MWSAVRLAGRRLCTAATAAVPRPKNLFEIVSLLPQYGVGSRLYRKSWARKGYAPEGHHWVVTKTVLTRVRLVPQR